MKIIITISRIALALFLLLSACDKGVEPEPEPGMVGTANDSDPGTPKKINIYPIPVPDNETHISFGLVADTHIDASYAGWSPDWMFRDTPRVINNRSAITYLNYATYHAGCLGIVHLGDMTDACHVQNLVAFRQHWENDYPGSNGGAIAGAPDKDYHAYDQGYRINKPVFPGLGNHGDYNKVISYIADRVIDAPGLIAHYESTSYIWRWGKYYFIHLGLSAANHEDQYNMGIHYGKLNWLKNWLAENVGGSNLGILIFHHYGWDEISTDPRWWTQEMRDAELNVLCRRDSTNQVAKPYNVLAIFTGHKHNCPIIQVFAGLDSLGNRVYFDNLVMRAVIPSNDDGGYGWAIVRLSADSLNIRYHEIHHPHDEYWGKRIHVGH